MADTQTRKPITYTTTILETEVTTATEMVCSKSLGDSWLPLSGWTLHRHGIVMGGVLRKETETNAELH